MQFQLPNNLTVLFLVTIVISYVGSLQPGFVNVLASRLLLSHGKKYAYLYSFGASIPEIFYAFISSYLVGSIKIDKYKLVIGIVVALVLIVFGLYTYFNPPKVEIKKSRFDDPILKGVVMSFSNPQLIVFWSGMILVFYPQWGLIPSTDLLWCVLFSLGAAVGAFLLLISYIALSEIYLKNMEQSRLMFLNKISAYVLIVIGIMFILGLFL